MSEDKKSYKVVSDFNDAGGKAWKAGQTYTGGEQEISAGLTQGLLVEDTAAKKR